MQNKKVEVHPFGCMDWLGLSGAEQFADDGCDPVICDYDDRFMLVGAGQGLELIMGDEMEDTFRIAMPIPTQRLAFVIVEAVAEKLLEVEGGGLTVEKLESLGFRRSM